MSIEYKGPRLAPKPERESASEKLDAVVAIPVFNESVENVIGCLWSIATQKKRKDEPFTHGVVVVINNRPLDLTVPEHREIQAKNRRVYNTLMPLNFGYSVSVGNKDVDAQIKEIQKNGLRIDVIDAFEGPHAHPDNNVGRARLIADQHSIDNMMDFAERTEPLKEGARPLHLTTDADSRYHPEALAAVWRAFSWGNVDAGRLRVTTNKEGLDRQSRNAAQLYTLYWNMRNASQSMPERKDAMRQRMLLSKHEPFKESGIAADLINLGGASSVYAGDVLKKTGGHPPIPTSEDTELGFKVIEAGGKVSYIPDARVITDARISERTTRGFGAHIASFSIETGSFADIPVEHPEAYIEHDAFLQKIDPIYRVCKSDARQIEGDNKIRSDFFQACNESHIPSQNAEALWQAFVRWDGRVSSREHDAFVRVSQQYFFDKFGKSSIAEYIDWQEKNNQEYYELCLENTTLRAYDPRIFSGVDWNFLSEKEYMLELIDLLGITRENKKEQSEITLRTRAVVASEYPDIFTAFMQEFWIASALSFVSSKEFTKATGLRPMVVGKFEKPLTENQIEKIRKLDVKKLRALNGALYASFIVRVHEKCADALESLLTGDEKKRFAELVIDQKADAQEAWDEVQALGLLRAAPDLGEGGDE